MNKYFQIYEYDDNWKARLTIYQLQSKATLRWKETKLVREMSEQEVTWEQFQKHFKDSNLTEQFYDDKAKEFHDIKLGQQTMDEFIAKFTLLLKYVPPIHEEKAKVHYFISYLPIYMKSHHSVKGECSSRYERESERLPKVCRRNLGPLQKVETYRTTS